LCGIGTALLLYSFFSEYRQPAAGREQIASLDMRDINTFDQNAVGNHSPSAAAVSHATAAAALAAPLGMALPSLRDRHFRQVLTLLCMYAESFVIAWGLERIVKTTVRRPRPLLYCPSVSIDKKVSEGKWGTQSFYSGHTSKAFCSALFFASVYSTLYPRSPFRYALWPLSLGIAGTTGILRYVAGEHYPTDIIIGAAVGSLIGYGVPAIHRNLNEKKLSLYPIINQRYTGVGIARRF
jgi:hypothetical protein